MTEGHHRQSYPEWLTPLIKEAHRLAADFREKASSATATAVDHDRAAAADSILNSAEKMTTLLNREEVDVRLAKLCRCKTEAEVVAETEAFQAWTRDNTLGAWVEAIHRLLALKYDRILEERTGSC